MRQQDSGRTREWIEKTAGQTYITQATAYHGAGDGGYREARHAEVRPVSRVSDAGPKRLGRDAMLRPPDPEEVPRRLERLDRIAGATENGELAQGPDEEIPPGLAALLRGFREAARQGGDARAGPWKRSVGCRKSCSPHARLSLRTVRPSQAPRGCCPRQVTWFFRPSEHQLADHAAHRC
jgi:hypothetical protein